ncbi:TIGR03086 family metal-binding protein [Streptomyces zingiberis]|uniref:TIGR03086 family protein n=1 Tax=Streptomyces zingiberis TaxID=2053010 RepID=A0ABX1BZZ1_9ACTN|nr:TIGR03086 family metal-binding protein [Streptomyces zingiberis]NJQ00229.1 TIGR03086 family protein [Streptomyces zingiberis]
MDLLDAFDNAWLEFDRRVHRVGAEQWDEPTPCADWTVRDLVNHLTAEHLWAPWLLRGATLAEVGDRFEGDVLGDDPVAAWERAAAESHDAFHRPGALEGRVHTSGGPSPTTEYGWQMTTDLAVHAWDLARGIGDDDTLDEELAGELHERTAPLADSLQGSGLFAAPVSVPGTARAQDRLVGLLGREP